LYYQPFAASLDSCFGLGLAVIAEKMNSITQNIFVIRTSKNLLPEVSDDE